MNNGYYSLQTATKKTGKKKKEILNYSSMGYIDTEERDGKTYYNSERLTKQRDVDHHGSKDGKYLKPIFELLEMLSEYFPIEYLDSDEYDKLEAALIRYEKKCEKIGLTNQGGDNEV